MQDASTPVILVAADSFKDALPAHAVCRAIAEGLHARNPNWLVNELPLADGGEGAYAVLTQQLGLREMRIASVDPLFRPIEARYGLDAAGHLAVIEMAQTSGLQLLAPHERNAAQATSRGVGLLIADAIKRGAQRILLTIGGSASNDGGIGMATALGWTFLDAAGQPLQAIGASLAGIARIEPPAARPRIQIDVLCDVTNPLYGPNGAAYVYARQKGADDAMIEQLDQDLRAFAQCVSNTMTMTPSPDTPGAGAAGGLGFGAMAFLGARLVSGIDAILELTHFDDALSRANLLITGEGSLDAQTAHGKLIDGLCRRAKVRGVPVIALCGRLALTAEQIQSIGLTAAYQINDGNGELTQRLANTGRDLAATARSMPLPL